MGEQGGLRTGWLAAFGTEGYEGEPPLLEELGVNFGHIKGKVCVSTVQHQEKAQSIHRFPAIFPRHKRALPQRQPFRCSRHR